MLKKLFFILLTTVITILFFNSCKQGTEPPPPTNYKITLEAEDASCTEAWINIKIDDRITLPTEITIKQNDSTITEETINSNDTTLFIENLLPNQTYFFQASGIKYPESSNQLPVTTMDTTSHNFTWETFTFGNSASRLKDVAIINENNIWAVGEIHTEDTDKFDSNGVWVQPYNAVHWDGEEWELERIFINDYFYPLYSIYAFNENDIWFANLSLIHWNGKNFKFYTTPPQNSNSIGWNINSIWGTSSEDFYVVGNSGNIAHYNGSSWRKIESGTELNITDIWGDYNDKMGKWEILAVARSDSDFRTAILQIDNNNVISHPIVKIGNVVLGTTWFLSNKAYYVAGMETYKKYNLDNKPWGENGSLDSGLWHYIAKMRANNINDIIGVGGYGEVIHFNGVSWKSYYNKTMLNGGNYKSVDVKGNLVVVVGYKTPLGAITIGKR